MTQLDNHPGQPAGGSEPDAPTDLTRAARRRWARAMLAGVTDRPRYGSREWLALPDGDRRKVAAVVVAAECWAADLDELPQRLEAELQAYRAAEDAYYASLHARAVELVKPLTKPNCYRAKSLAERLEWARTPRPGDRHPRPDQHDTDDLEQTERPESGDAA